MSYRCGIGPGLRQLGLEPGPPRITCDTCGTTREIGVNGIAPAWFLNGDAVPGWKLARDGERRVDTCGRCSARSTAARKGCLLPGGPRSVSGENERGACCEAARRVQYFDTTLIGYDCPLHGPRGFPSRVTIACDSAGDWKVPEGFRLDIDQRMFDEVLARLAASQAEESALKDQLFAARGNRRAADAECASTMADMARVIAARDGLAGALERARGLLKRSLWLGGGMPGEVRTDPVLTIEVRAFLATPPTPIATPGTERRALCGCTKQWHEPSLGELDRITPATSCPDCHHPGPHDKPCDYYATPEAPTEEET